MIPPRPRPAPPLGSHRPGLAPGRARGFALGFALGFAATACGRSPEPPPGPPARRVLRVCADPNHLPYSNAREEGFENRLAELVARELDAELAYVWRPQRRGFLRTGVNAGACDVVMGIASEVDHALTTQPYYRSTYVVVQPSGATPVTSLDDPALAELRIGVQIVGDDYSNSPPAHALARRGLAGNLVGYMVYGDYGHASPLADVVRGLARGEADLAVVWGPVGGYFAPRAGTPLAVHPITPGDDAGLPMQFAISLAVQRGRTDLQAELDAILERRRAEIDALLETYAVPRV